METDTADRIDRSPKDAETYELAFACWSTGGRRSPTHVSALLKAAGKPVDERTIRRWAADDDWPSRYRSELAAAFPDSLNVMIGSLVRIALAGGQSIAATTEDGRTPDKALVQATYGAYDRLGLSALGKTTAPELRQTAGDQVAHALPDLAGKSADELEAMLRQQMGG